MRVLWIVNLMLPEFAAAVGLPHIPTGGWMPALVDALRRLAPMVRLTIVCEGPSDLSAEVEGVSYRAYRQMRRPWPGAVRRRAAFATKLRQLIEETQPDLVHFHGTENGYLSLPESTWGDMPRLVSIQGVINGCYPHYMGGLTPKALKRFRNWPRYLLTRRTLFDVADAWRRGLAVSEAQALGTIPHIAGRTDWDCAWARTLAPNAEYHRVGEVLRKEFYAACTDGRAIPHRIFASAAFKYPLKGGHVLLQAATYLKKAWPDVRIVVADAQGKIHPRTVEERLRQTEYHRYLRQLIDDLDLWGHVELLPSLDSASMSEELRKAHVFCLPSFVENSPNSLGEAQLVGVPVVATAVGGVPSMVQPHVTGELVPSGDSATLAVAVSNLFADDRYAARLVRAARQIARERHDESRVVGELIDCYGKVAHAKNP